MLANLIDVFDSAMGQPEAIETRLKELGDEVNMSTDQGRLPELDGSPGTETLLGIS